MYGIIQVQVIPFALVLYALGIGYFVIRGRKQIATAAPEELAARRAEPAAKEATP